MSNELLEIVPAKVCYAVTLSKQSNSDVCPLERKIPHKRALPS